MIGQTISHYLIQQELGSGGMGEVFLAKDLKLDRLVAIKFLASFRQAEPENEERFISEAKAASALDHRGISVIHEVDRTDADHLFMVMTYYPGGSIKERLDGGAMPVHETLDLVIEIAAALQAAHAINLVHRDIKPSNIMLAADGSPKIIDFGLAKLSDQITLTRTGSSLGTVAYMSPEQVRGEAVDQRSDLFSLGIMLFEMLTGHLPFHCTNEASAILSIINEKPHPLSRYLDEIPPGLQYILNRALAKFPADRYQSTAEFQADLQRVRARQTTGPGVTTRLATAGRRWRRRLSTRTMVGFAFLASLALAGYLGVQFFPGGRSLPEGSISLPCSVARCILVKPDGSGDSPTIQAALKAAAAGDTILLANGIFTGKGNTNLHVPEKPLTLMSLGNDPSVCIIDCRGHQQQEAFGFKINFLADTKVVFKGFTIANSWTRSGGGALNITNCSPTISNCVFVNNEVAPDGSGTGGAIKVARCSSSEIIDCVFENNRAADAGGGINVSDSAGSILRCVFRGNWALHGGSGVYLSQSEVEIRDCLFTGNSCGPGNWGSSLHFDRMESRGTVTNCTFAGDKAPDEVIFARRGASPTLRNCLIAFNGPGVAVNFDGTPIALEGCNIYGNQGGDWAGVIAGGDSSSGNFSADPLFCHLQDDIFALGSGSPCLPQNNSTGCLVGALGQGCQDRRRLAVPHDFTTIAEALNAAMIGDTVLVAAGTWTEYALRLPAGVTLLGATGNASDVVIDARRQGRVILCDSLQTGVRIEAVTLTGGWATGSYPHDRGGGIACFSTSIDIIDCLITDNQAYDGGGIFSEDSPAIHLQGSEITGNTSDYWGGGYSGRNCPDLVLTDCSFTGNRTGKFGGGFHLKNTRARVRRCTFRNNTAWTGSAALSQQSTVHFHSCLITGNLIPNNSPAGIHGGGTVGFIGGSDNRLTSCTLANNQAGSYHGAINLFKCDLLVTHTIIFGSSSGSAIRSSSSQGLVSLACSNLFANKDRNFIQRLQGLEGKNGNLSLDPLFMDMGGGDFRLQPESPCSAAANPGCGLIGALPVGENQDLDLVLD